MTTYQGYFIGKISDGGGPPTNTIQVFKSTNAASASSFSATSSDPSLNDQGNSFGIHTFSATSCVVVGQNGSNANQIYLTTDSGANWTSKISTGELFIICKFSLL